MTGVAVKVTGFPRQNGFEEGVIETPAGKLGFTVIFTGDDIAGLLVVQVEKVEVSRHVIASPFEGI